MNLYSLFVYIEHNGDESPKGTSRNFIERDVLFCYMQFQDSSLCNSFFSYLKSDVCLSDKREAFFPPRRGRGGAIVLIFRAPGFGMLFTKMT